MRDGFRGDAAKPDPTRALVEEANGRRPAVKPKRKRKQKIETPSTQSTRRRAEAEALDKEHTEHTV
jgi:hypothetical protein